MKTLFDLDILQYCAAGVFVINSQHNVVYWNKACETLTGIKADSMVGTDMHWWAFYNYAHPCLADLIIDRETDKIVEYYDVSGKSPLLSDGWHAEDWFQNLGGKQRYMIFDASPIYDRDGKLTAAIETLEDITERKRIEEENIKLATELKKASDGVKLLSGLLPICAACKKIRDDKGYWKQIEMYIQDHSEAKFSHGICPECARKLYPDLNIK